MEHMTRYNGRKLAGLMAAQGRTGKWLARQVGISEASISRLMHGKQSVDAVLAQRIAATLQVPLFLCFDVHDGPKIGRPRTVREEEEQAA
jgi:transcriptional regulator with XRE-family HTH domain